MRNRGKKLSHEEFQRRLAEAFRGAAADAVDEGIAQLDEGENVGGTYLTLTPANQRAAAITMYLDYPTLSVGPDGEHTTEMFGPEEERIRRLPQLVRAVIDGGFEWRHLRPEVSIRPFRFRPVNGQRGTFHTPEGPWTFHRYSIAAREPDAPEHGRYEPYRSIGQPASLR